MSNVTQITKTRTKKYMGIPMQNQFRAILQKLKNDANSAPEAEPIEFQKMSDESDVATMQENLTMDLRRRERETFLNKKITKSLAKLDNGEYGYCDDCGGEIGEGRLHARPTADLCITCKEIAEKAENQFCKKRAA